MTKEYKDLLLKDICMRLPYGVKYRTYLGDIFTLKDITLSRTTTKYYIGDNAFSIDQIQLYLRPMSTMTALENSVYNIIKRSIFSNETDGYLRLVEWLNEHHFDYNYLINKGLALKAPKDMYKFY